MNAQPEVPEYIRSLVPYVPGKPIEETQRELGIRRVIKLASNENPLGPSPKALQVLRSAAKSLHRYPDGAAFSLKRELAARLGVDASSLIIGNGSNEVIDLLIRTYCVPGDRMVTSEGAFIAYRLCAQIHGVETLASPLTPDLRFDLDAMLRLVKGDDRVKVVFIANPNNPTGTYVTTSELKSLLEEMRKIRGGSVLVALDYAYWEYVTASDLPDPIELMRQFPNIVVLRTFSKIHGLAGLRVGYGVASPGIISSLERVRQPFNVNSLALAAAEAALSDEAFVARARKTNEQGLQFWEGELKKAGIPFWKSQGNFILVDVLKGLGMSGPEAFEACLREGVIFRPVANYGMPYALRISVGTPTENRVAARILVKQLKKGKVSSGRKGDGGRRENGHSQARSSHRD